MSHSITGSAPFLLCHNTALTLDSIDASSLARTRHNDTVAPLDRSFLNVRLARGFIKIHCYKSTYVEGAEGTSHTTCDEGVASHLGLDFRKDIGRRR